MWQTLERASHKSQFSCKCICQPWKTQEPWLSYKIIGKQLTVNFLTEWETTRSCRTKSSKTKLTGNFVVFLPPPSWVCGCSANLCRHQLKGKQSWAVSQYSSGGLCKLSPKFSSTFWMLTLPHLSFINIAWELVALMGKALRCLRLGLCDTCFSFCYIDTNTICHGDGLSSHCSRSWKSWPALHVKIILYNLRQPLLLGYITQFTFK